MKHYKVIKAFLNNEVGAEIQVSDWDLQNPNTDGFAKWKNCLEIIPDAAPVGITTEISPDKVKAVKG